MKAPRFWWDASSLVANLLRPLGFVYGALSAYRMTRTGYRAARPVICIGNFVAGGAGKTPTAIWVAHQLRHKGYRPVFLTRGYGGSERGPVRVDPARHKAHDIGDEALLLAKIATTIVARDRAEGAKLAADFGDVIIMDDGLQNPSLQKDFTLAVVDQVQGLGNGYVFPAGPLRAPFATQMMKVDACLILGDDARNADFKSYSDKPVYAGQIVADANALPNLADENYLAFAGIGRPEKFFETLRALGASVRQARSFPDHYPYSRDDVNALRTTAANTQLRLITTEKDAVRIAAIDEALLQDISVLPVVLQCDDGEALLAAIERAIASQPTRLN